MNLEVESLLQELSYKLDNWPEEKIDKIHEVVSVAEIEQVISQLKSLHGILKSDLDKAQ